MGWFLLRLQRAKRSHMHPSVFAKRAAGKGNAFRDPYLTEQRSM